MTKSTSDGSERRPAPRAIRTAGEAVLGLLAFGTVWPFGSVDALWESVAFAGVALLMALWAAHAALTRQLQFRFDAPALLLAGLVLLSGLQLLPLPAGAVRMLSPSSARLHEEMRPAESEILPGEAEAVPRPTSFPISLDPRATRIFACRLFALLAIYLAARNWLASRESFRRLAWGALLNGVALAAFALGQYFSAPPSTIYWTVPTDGAAFGPFICRNHYPDYLALCAGLALGIMVTQRKPPALRTSAEPPPCSLWEEAVDMVSAPLRLLDRPAVLAASAGVGLMLVSIPFSLSRGGMLALLAATLGTFFLARWRAVGAGAGNRTAVTLAAATALVIVSWFGWQPLEKRFGELGGGTTLDDRTPLWKATLAQVPGFWLGGAGNGSHLRVEPLGRGDTASLGSDLSADHAHNEFVEAAIEGGIPRLAIAIALPVFLLVSLARAFRRQRTRSAGPLILGAWFGLAAVAFHAPTDFALHIPAVALLAVIVAAFAQAAASDGELHPIQRHRRSRPPAEMQRTSRSRTPRPLSTGWPAAGIAASLVLVTALVAWDARQRHLADRYAGLAGESGRQRIARLEASVAADPTDPDAHFRLAQAHLDAVAEDGPVPSEALAGPILPRRARSERPSAAMIEEHIFPAIRSLRTARELCPLLPEVHARLGMLAGHCARAEPALAHLERAKRLLPNDPEIWFACGAEAARVGDRAGAIAQWKRSLELSPKQLRPILRTARRTLTPDEMLGALLPDDPVVLLGAAEDLYPDRRLRRAERLPFLRKAAEGGRKGSTARQWIATANARRELDRFADAREAWQRAIELEPESAEAHDGLARLLEGEELYAEAQRELDWLAARRPADPDLKLRSLAARHGAELQRQIGR